MSRARVRFFAVRRIKLDAIVQSGEARIHTVGRVKWNTRAGVLEFAWYEYSMWDPQIPELRKKIRVLTL